MVVHVIVSIGEGYVIFYPNRITVFIICDTGRTCNFFLSGGRKILRGSSAGTGDGSRGVKKNGTGVLGGTSNGQKTKTKEKRKQKINTIYRTVTQETQ